MISVQDILLAKQRIAPYILETPVEPSLSLLDETGTNVFLKLENQQVSGSFKLRGGLNKIIKTLHDKPGAEFVAPTAVGHGVGLSYAAKVLGAKSHILMPKSADPDRVKEIHRNGASLQFFDSVPEARIAARKLEKEKGYVYVSAYNDVEMIEGAGTIGVELLNQLPQVDCLVCGVGGGGYLAGIATVLKAVNPQLKVYGVQQENAPFLAEWHRTRKYPIHFQGRASIAEGIGAMVEEETITWPYIEQFVDDFIIVSEENIKASVLWMLNQHKQYAEPSGVVGLSAIRKRPDVFRNFKNVLTIITGRNFSFERFKNLIM